MRKYFFLLALFLLHAPAASANFSPWRDHDGYANKAFHKLVYGLENVALGWTEIITEPLQNHNTGKQLTDSIGTGFKNAFADTLGGVFHTVTFPLTTADVVLPEKGIRL